MSFDCTLLIVIFSCFAMQKFSFSQDYSFIALSLPKMKGSFLFGTWRVFCTKDFGFLFTFKYDGHVLVGTKLS